MEERADYRMDGEEYTVTPEGKLTPKQVLRREETIPCMEPVAFMLYPEDSIHDERCVCSKHLTKIVADGDIVATGDFPEGATCAYHYPTITQSGHCMWCSYPVDSCICDALGIKHEFATARRASNAKRFIVENGAKQIDIWADSCATYDGELFFYRKCTETKRITVNTKRNGPWWNRTTVTELHDIPRYASESVACFAPGQWTHWFLADDPNYGGIPT